MGLAVRVIVRIIKVDQFLCDAVYIANVSWSTVCGWCRRLSWRAETVRMNLHSTCSA